MAWYLSEQANLIWGITNEKANYGGIRASLIVISGAQAGIPVAIDANLNGRLKPDDGQNALSNGRKRKTLRKSDKCVQTGAAVKNGIRDVQGLVQSAQSVSQELMQFMIRGMLLLTITLKILKGRFGTGQIVIVRLQSNGYLPEPGYSGDLVRGCEATFLSQLARWNTVTSWRASFVRTTRRWKTYWSSQKCEGYEGHAGCNKRVALEQLKFEKLKFQYQMYRESSEILQNIKRRWLRQLSENTTWSRATFLQKSLYGNEIIWDD